jgi:N-acyl homoserine lactone hydrolase
MRLIAALFLLILTACAASPGAHRDQPLRLYALDCGELQVTDADPFADDGAYKGQPKRLVVPCYLIRHAKGDLIWDTGVPEEIRDKPVVTADERIIVRHMLSDQLRQLGLSPADIEYLSLSHSHFDHIGNAGLFAGSTWIVNERELAHAFRPAARADAAEFARYAALENSQKIVLKGAEPYDVFGDQSVQIIPAPGHTPGHSVLLLRLAKAGPVLLTGDMWHIAESRAARRVPRFNNNRAETLSSMDAVEALASRTGARIVRQHVPEDFTVLPPFPRSLS